MRCLVALVAACGLFACAERQQLPPGTELEQAEAPPPVEDAGQSEMPQASDKELATAWEPPPKPPPPALKPGEPAPSSRLGAGPDEEQVERTLNAQAEAEARAKLKDLLVVTKLVTVFDSYESEKEALASFN